MSKDSGIRTSFSIGGIVGFVTLFFVHRVDIAFVVFCIVTAVSIVVLSAKWKGK